MKKKIEIKAKMSEKRAVITLDIIEFQYLIKVLQNPNRENDIKNFIRQELSLAKQQWIEESVEGIGKKIKEIEMKEIPSNIAIYKHQDDAYKAGWNNALLFFRVHGLDDVLSYLKGGVK